jgi:hypothetical protein
MDCGSIFLWAVVIWIAWGIGVWIINSAKESKPVPAAKATRETVPATSPPPAPSTEQEIETAKEQYRRAIAMIDGLPVDEDQKATARRQANRNLMKRVRELMGERSD